jgi:hypothetical protein
LLALLCVAAFQFLLLHEATCHAGDSDCCAAGHDAAPLDLPAPITGLISLGSVLLSTPEYCFQPVYSLFHPPEFHA